MSIQELQARSFIHYLTKLYVKESPNDFTMDEIIYGFPTVTKRLSGGIIPYLSIEYYNGHVMLKDKYSPVKLQLALKDVYKWAMWRNKEFLPSRWNYITKYDIISTRADDLSKPDLRAILSKMDNR